MLRSPVARLLSVFAVAEKGRRAIRDLHAMALVRERTTAGQDIGFCRKPNAITFFCV